jgi:hypothetical protein
VNSNNRVCTGLLIVGAVIGYQLCAESIAGEFQSKDSAEQALRQIRLVDTDGVVHLPLQGDSTVAIALIFVSTDCPLANAFQPALRKISETYKDQGVCCFMIHSSPKAVECKVVSHINEYGITMPVVVDSDQSIAHLVEAKVTPEAIVVDRSGHVRYRGLINNLYAGFGKKRQKATEHYLTDALDALIGGDPVRNTITRPIGCFIHYANRINE